MNSLLVMIGGALGALGRYQFGRMAGQVLGTGWPWGTPEARSGGVLEPRSAPNWPRQTGRSSSASATAR